MYNAYVTTLKNVRKHNNADRLKIGECFGNPVVVSLEYEEGMLGVYFPTDGALSAKFAEKHNLVRKKDDAGNNIGGYLDPDKRNIKAIHLRGEKSDGIFMPLSCLEPFGPIDELKEGDIINTFNGHLICEKYIPRANKSNSTPAGNRTRKKKVAIAPLFAEHADTEQLAYNLSSFKSGDYVEISLKMHGTSHRVGYLPTFQGYKRTFWDKILRREGTPIYDWDYVSGTRRTVLADFDGGYYGDNSFRQKHSDKFVGKLHKGETVYMEIVGFTDNGTPIMSDGSNSKLGEDFIKHYGKTTRFSYGCHPTPTIGTGISERPVPQSECYVYRMTMTNENGVVIEYTPDYVRYRCEQMGVKCVPVLWAGVIPSEETDWISNSLYPDFRAIDPGEWIKAKAEECYDGPDPIGKTHIREGVVCRIVNRPKFAAYKHKNFEFKVIEGLIKDTAAAPDMEEAQEVTENG